MNRPSNKRPAPLSWLFGASLLVLCGVLGFLQYRWIEEVSVAARERLHASLQASLARLSQDFDAELSAACRTLLPGPETPPEPQAIEAAISAHYRQWAGTAGHAHLFRRIAMAAPEGDGVALRNLSLDQGSFESVTWPAEWAPIEQRIAARLSAEAREGRGGPRPPLETGGTVFEIPVFRMREPGAPPGPFGRREAAWLIFDLNLQYARDVMLPELVQRHLESGGNLDYQVEVLTRTATPMVIYQSDPGESRRFAASADASVDLFAVEYAQIFRRWLAAGLRRTAPQAPGFQRAGARVRATSMPGRWQLFVRHRAGSLEAVVAQARWRNLAVTAGVMLLMLASLGALVRFTRRSQKLAEMQMDFVAGVSHELRTPLTVIHTAAYNLRGKVAQNPAQVERYGELIQSESGRLKELVEQVLQFAGSEAGRIIRERKPVSVESVIEGTMESSRAVLQSARCVIEKSVDPGLPPVIGDPTALQHALQNLVSNAAKYGAAGNHWIGVFASQATDDRQAVVEIRVADRGPGIPEDEQKHIFDPFFRGRRAIADQVHGTGLGLSLTKKIVEAHGGSIRVKSEPAKGTEFIVRIPAAPAGAPA